MHGINPFFQPASLPVAVTRKRDHARYARLPEAPITGSPVPHLTSLYHNAEPGPYGNRGYPGNCGGNLIKDLLRYLPTRVRSSIR